MKSVVPRVFFLLLAVVGLFFVWFSRHRLVSHGGGMDISIEKINSRQAELWVVSAGTLRLHFKDQRSAMEFSSKWKERVESPHSLPVIESETFARATTLN